MQTVLKSIDVVAIFNPDGKVRPLKMRLSEDGEETLTIPIDKILVSNPQKFGTYHSVVFKCRSIVNNQVKLFDIRFEKETMKWYLIRI